MRQALTRACLVAFAPRLCAKDGTMIRSLVLLFSCCSVVVASAQAPGKTPTTDSPSAVDRGLQLARSGHCQQALPLLKKAVPVATDKSLKMKTGLAIVRCGLVLQQMDTVVNALLWLNRDFPTEPEVLYVTTHAFSDLATNVAMQLARTARGSYQAHELNAETLETQGKWDEATAEYNQILKSNPDLPGIHYRLGRIILSQPATPNTVEDARKEFRAELQIDPNNAGAEYVLGELARQQQEWDEAILHFERAIQLDASFADAFLGLGYSLKALGRYAEAVGPLESAVKLQPENPTAHYQLSIAYGKTGQKEEAKREMELFQRTSEKASEQTNGGNLPAKERASPQ
jgi:tetratricopeptide (TPR) repeat protein